MNRRTVRPLLALLVLGALSCAFAAPPAIGVAMAKGAFRVDDSPISGNSTLFDGAKIQAGVPPLQLLLNTGVRLQLASEASGVAYRDRFVLERGEARLLNSAAYYIDARTLRILTASPASVAHVTLAPGDRVQVTALHGPVRVTTAAGIEVGNLTPSTALLFEPQVAGAAAPSKLTGCLEKRNGRFLLKDETSGVTVELQGPDLDKETGNRVEVTGTLVPEATPAKPATQLIRVIDLKRLATGCAPGLPLPAKIGMAAKTKAIIAGVVIAGATATGLTIGLTRGAPPTPSFSP